MSEWGIREWAKSRGGNKEKRINRERESKVEISKAKLIKSFLTFAKRLDRKGKLVSANWSKKWEKLWQLKVKHIF